MVVLEVIENRLSSIILAGVYRISKVTKLGLGFGLQRVAVDLLIEDVQAVGCVLDLGISSSIRGWRSPGLDVIPFS